MIPYFPLTGTKAKPRICIATTAISLTDLQHQCKSVLPETEALLELRYDFFSHAASAFHLLQTLHIVHNELPHTPILFTLRTQTDGGAYPQSPTAYAQLIKVAIHSGLISYIDIEYNQPHSIRNLLITEAQKKHVPILMSLHAMQQTPSLETLLTHFAAMKKHGAAIAKIACMPHTPADVLTMLYAVKQIKEIYPHYPIIGISMGKLGRITRLYGSAITFTTVSSARTAPGQFSLPTLKARLSALYKI